MAQLAVTYARPLDQELTGSPHDFEINLGNTVPGPLGNRATEETLIRLILVCQTAGQWVGLDYDEFIIHQRFDALTGSTEVVSEFARHDGDSRIRRGLIRLAELGLIELRYIAANTVIILPTQSLVDFAPLQAYRRR